MVSSKAFVEIEGTKVLTTRLSRCSVRLDQTNANASLTLRQGGADKLSIVVACVELSKRKTSKLAAEEL